MIRIIVLIQSDFLQYTFLLLYNTIINSSAPAYEQRSGGSRGKHNSAALRLARAELWPANTALRLAWAGHLYIIIKRGMT